MKIPNDIIINLRMYEVTISSLIFYGSQVETNIMRSVDVIKHTAVNNHLFTPGLGSRLCEVLLVRDRLFFGVI